MLLGCLVRGDDFFGGHEQLELTERMVAHMALDTPGSLARVATSCSYILVLYVVYKSGYSILGIVSFTQHETLQMFISYYNIILFGPS